MSDDPVLAGIAVDLPAQLQALDEVYAALDRLEAAMNSLCVDPHGPTALMGLRTAVIEIATNIIRHAYPPGAPTGALRLLLQLYADRVEAHLSDDGIPYSLPETLFMPDLDDLTDLPEGGFGLFLARQSVDQLTHTRTDQGANHWRLVKHFAGST